MSDARRTAAIYILDAPRLEDLCSVTVTVPPLPNSTAGSPYQPHIIRCRELIFTEPEILASPLLHMDRHIQIIMQQSYYKTGRLQARFQKIGIEMQKPRRVIAHELQAAMNYTIHAKMAPLWNKLGELMVEGREFMANTGRSDAISFELNVTVEQTCLALRGHNIRSLPVKLRDLDVSAPMIQEFCQSAPSGVIHEYSISRKWCHILPSMKKGQVVSVHQTMPDDSPFKSYKDMKRYWKNTYGYRLPESEEGVLYCQVYFKLVGEQLFTYPHYCIRPYQPTYLASHDGTTAINAFLRDLPLKVTGLCGVKLKVTSEAQYTRPDLCHVKDLECEFSSNLGGERPKEPTPHRSVAPPTATLVRQGATLVHGELVSVPDTMRLPQICDGVTTSQSIRSYSCSQIPDKQSQIVLQRSSQNIPANQSIEICGSQLEPTNQINDVTDSSCASQKRIIPVFKSLKAKFPASAGRPGVVGSNTPRVVPLFTARRPATQVTRVTQSCTPAPRALPPTNQHLISATRPDQAIKLSNQNTATALSNQNAPMKLYNQNTTMRMSNQNAPMKLSNQNTPMRMSSQHTPIEPSNRKPATSLSTHTKLSRKYNPAYDQITAQPHATSMTYSRLTGYRPSDMERATDSGYYSTPQTPTAGDGSSSGAGRHLVDNPVLGSCDPSIPCPPDQWGAASMPSSAQKHRRIHDNRLAQDEDCSMKKKPRAKPQIQDNVDIEQLARAQQLHKANTATLSSWLKERGVVCKAKDKKIDLVLKVQNLLGL